MRELLQAGVAVLGGVEARLQQPQRERRQREHLAAPRHRLLLEAVERHDGVDEAHLERLRASYWRQRNQISLAFFWADEVAQDRRAEAAVEGADARAGLPEARVVGGDREVAHEVQDVPAADRVAGDHRDDRLRQAAHLHVQVGDVEAPDRFAAGVGQVARVAADALVAARAERERALAGEDHDADLGVLARALERVGQLDDGLRAKRVADLGAVDRDLRDPDRSPDFS